MNHSHYFKSVKHLEMIDVYRVLDLFAVTDSALAHAAKKILCAGNRGAKDQAKDVQEAIDSLQRWQEMQRENIVGMTAQQAIAFEDKELPSSGIYLDQVLGKPKKFDIEQFVKCQQSIHAGLTVEQAIEVNSVVDSLIYADESQYTEADKQAASLDPALVELCSKTTIHADKDGWILHAGDKCPVTENKMVEIELVYGGRQTALAFGIYWQSNRSVTDIKRWRYAK